jgi:hypothetical protein
MNKESMTLTRALKELQLLPKRIERSILELRPLAITTKKTAPTGFQSVEEFTEKSKAGFQSAKALIVRQAALWAAVAQANAVTKVDIKGTKMTIAEAIKYRNEIVKQKKLLLNQLTRLNADAEQRMMLVNTEYKQRQDTLLQSTFGKATKVKEEDAKAVLAPFQEANEPILHDPLKVKDEIKLLQDEIDDIEKEIDLTLSEVNAMTTIEVVTQ